jgi:hypothetical protein
MRRPVCHYCRIFITAGSRPLITASFGSRRWKLLVMKNGHYHWLWTGGVRVTSQWWLEFLDIPKLDQKIAKNFDLIPRRSHQLATWSRIAIHKSCDFSRKYLCTVRWWDSNLRPLSSRVATLTTPPLSNLCLYGVFIPLVFTSQDFEMNI